MNFFCLLWIPLFFLFRLAFVPVKEDGIIFALPLGVVCVLVQWYFGELVAPGGFGLSRWMNGFTDIVCLPVLVSLVICLLLIAVKALPTDADITGFILLFMIPFSVLRSIQWSTPGIPVMLVLVPILWTALGTGISFFISCTRKYPRWYVIIPSALGIAVFPVIVATSWWAFYGQLALIGYLCLFASIIPLLIRTVLGIVKKKWLAVSG